MDIDQQIADADDRLLHVWADSDSTDHQRRGRAKAELERRSREWQEDQAKQRRDFEFLLSNDEGLRAARREIFEKGLAKEQMAHAEKLTGQQIVAAVSSAKATKLAAWAAAFSAAGALIAAAVALAQYLTK
jgi:hypothetical protein